MPLLSSTHTSDLVERLLGAKPKPASRRSEFGVASNTVHVRYRLQASNTRVETFLGREFLVVPAVLVRSQVLFNNLGLCLLQPEDITPEWAAGWNGIPVLVGPHPAERGQMVSGRSPDLWNERMVGWIFNAHVKQIGNGLRHLAGDVWLDVERASTVEGYQPVLDAVHAGTPVELSTGFATHIEEIAGSFQGTSFDLVLHPADPDHLVVSTDFTGACSVADGCGLGVNKFEGAAPMSDNEKKGILERARELFSSKRAVNEQAMAMQEAMVAARLEAAEKAFNALPVSDQERQRRIQTGLQQMFQGRGDVCVCDVFTDTSTVVFWVLTALGPEPSGNEYFQATFSETEAGFEFGEPVKVVRVTAYEPVAGNSEAPLVKASNCGCQNSEEESMSTENKATGVDAQLAAIAAAVGTLTATVGNLATDVATMKTAAESDPNPAIRGLKNQIGELVASVNALKATAAPAVEEQKRERNALVTKLAGHFRVPFTAEQLEAKPLEELRMLEQMADGEFTGRGGPRGVVGNSAEGQRFAAPVPYWEKKDAKQANGSN